MGLSFETTRVRKVVVDPSPTDNFGAPAAEIYRLKDLLAMHSVMTSPPRLGSRPRTVPEYKEGAGFPAPSLLPATSNAYVNVLA